MDRVKQITVHNDHLDIELEFIGDVVASVGEDKSLKVVNTRQDGYLCGGQPPGALGIDKRTS